MRSESVPWFVKVADGENHVMNLGTSWEFQSERRRAVRESMKD